MRYRQQTGPGVWSAWSTWTNANTNSRNLTGLQAAIYEWQVLSRCGATTSEAAKGTFSTCQSCDAATGLTATNVTATSATVSWAHPAPACVKRYRLRYRHRTTGTSWSAWTTATPTAATTTLTGLTSGKLHQWQVTAECMDGSSTPVTGTFTTPAALGGVPPLEVQAVTAGSISVFPNPSGDGRFQLETTGSISALFVYDSFGRMALQPWADDTELDLSALPAGLYLLQATLGDGSREMVKMVKSE